MTEQISVSVERPKIPDGFFEVSRDGQFLLLHPRLPRFAMLNETARFIASLCDGRRTSSDIAKVVSSHYGVELDRVEADVSGALRQLRAGGMFSDRDVAQKRSYGRVNKRVHLTITGLCNLRCKHCGAISSLHKSDGLSTSDVKGIVDQLAERPDSSIAITGGEPLLRGDIVEIVKYSAARVKTIVSTNATLVTEELAGGLGPLPVTFQVSLDGASARVHDAVRGAGAFEKALAGIRLLQAHGAGANVEVCRTLVGQPDEDLDALLELGERLEIGGIRFLFLARLGRAEDNFEALNPTLDSYRHFYRRFFDILTDSSSKLPIGGGMPGLYIDVPDDEMWCHVGEMFEVGPEGKIYPCSMLNQPEFELGNIWNMTLQQAAESDKFMNLHKVLASRMETVEACRKCSFKNYCQGGCPGMALVDNGTLLAEDAQCELRKELFEELFFEIFPKLKGKQCLSSSEEIQI
ncbi:MAG TPA: PqqD family peptide modification chaperone [bacterium]|nr:PqqD family peptide modification chaperone [bacterium]